MRQVRRMMISVTSARPRRAGCETWAQVHRGAQAPFILLSRALCAQDAYPVTLILLSQNCDGRILTRIAARVPGIM